MARRRNRPGAGQLSLFDAPVAPPSESRGSVGRGRTVAAPEEPGLDIEGLDFIPIQSSRVSAAAYDSKGDRLYLAWAKPGRPYVYEGVTSEEWRQFRRSKSKGRFVNRRLNGKAYGPVDL